MQPHPLISQKVKSIPQISRYPATNAVMAEGRKSSNRVLCWIPSKDSQGTAIEAVFSTWARHCDEIVFTSSTANPSRNVVALELPPLGPQRSLWNIVVCGWRYVLTRIDEFDWFVKLDDDTYFSADNFRHRVRNLDPEQPHYLGHTSHHLDYPFNLGAGHAISRGTLRIVGPRFPSDPDPTKDIVGFHCPRKITWAEDWQMGKCLTLAGVGKVTNSRDAQNRETFMSWLLSDNFITVRRNDSTSWFWRGKPRYVGHGMNCCSSRPILWHNLKVSDGAVKGMFELEYWLYEAYVDPL